MAGTELSEQRARFERLKQYATQDRGNKRLALDAANAGLAARDGAGAKEILLGALAEHPGDAELVFSLGTALLASADYTGAADQFQALLQAAETHPAIRYNLAYAHAGLGDFTAVLEALESLSDDELAAMPEALQLRARACHHLERLDEAIRLFRRYASLRPDQARAWGDLALAAFDGDDEATARIAAEQALKLDPQNVGAHLALGGMALEQRNIMPAHEHFSQTLQAGPENGRAWSGLAFALMMKLDFAQAKDAFAKAVRYMALDLTATAQN